MPTTLRHERKRRRTLLRRIVREHRAREQNLHYVLRVDLGGGAEIWERLACPRCPGYFEDPKAYVGQEW